MPIGIPSISSLRAGRSLLRAVLPRKVRWTPGGRGDRTAQRARTALAVYALGRALGIERDKIARRFPHLRGGETAPGNPRRATRCSGDRRLRPSSHGGARNHRGDSTRRYAGRRIWAVFEPRSNTSKRNLFEQEFAAALALADRVVIAPVLSAGKNSRRRTTVGRKASSSGSTGSAATSAPRKAESAAEIAAIIGREARPGDIVLVMSNGGFDNVQDKILSALAG